MNDKLEALKNGFITEEPIKDIDLIKNTLEENEALKSQIVGLENAYDKLADKFEKYYKALEIIKEKGIILQFIKETYTVEQYNAGVFGTLVKPLTQEEYDLLKEVFDE